jgi:hypothetical protein
LGKNDGVVKSLESLLSVIPEQAGIQYFHAIKILWIPVFTGMTTIYDPSKNDLMKKKSEERVVQEFPRRCPYCEKIISYENIKLKKGENEIECPLCKKRFIKVVLDSKKSVKP